MPIAEQTNSQMISTKLLNNAGNSLLSKIVKTCQ